MTGIYILSIIGCIALTIWIEKILILLVDKFIWKYMEKDEKNMIHELLEDSTRVQIQDENDENRQQDREKVI